MISQWEAIRRYCVATGKQPPVNLVDFAEWCEVHEPEFNERLEKHAANVYNRGIGHE